MLHLYSLSCGLIFQLDGQSNDIWFKIEKILLLLVIIGQLIISVNVLLKISKLKNIFKLPFIINNGFIPKDKLGSIEINSSDITYEENLENIKNLKSDELIKIPLVETKGYNKIVLRIKRSINTYLINNYGAAVNFSIIKDLIDREVDVQDEEITQQISTPLYLGLAATMLGIIFGLLSMPELTATNAAENNIVDTKFTDGINALIRSVKWAMGASFFGLFCTTILSSFFYKNAKTIVLNSKNEQLSYLQAKLLPELIKAEDTGVSGLKASLDRFARVATTIADNVLITANQTGENLILQQELIEKVEKMGVLKLSKVNLDLFSKLDENMDTYEKFSEYLSKMEDIAGKLAYFGIRISDIDKVINNIDYNLNDSRQLMKFLNVHFSKLETAGDAALKAVGLAETHFESAIESLKSRTDDMVNQLYKNAGNHELQLQAIYKEIEKSLNEITINYISDFKNAFSDATPKFDQLNNLSILPEFKDEMTSRVEILKDNSNTTIQSFDKIDNYLKKIQETLNNKSLTNTNENSENALSGNTNSNSGALINEAKEIKNPRKKVRSETRVASLKDVINGLFKER